MGSRRKARIIAFQTLYGWEMSGAAPAELMELDWIDDEKRERLEEDTLAFARLIVSGTIENIDQVDAAITGQLEHWDFTRLARVDLAILRMSVYSLLFQRDIPPSVTIDEAVDIAKEFGANDSYRFVNGVLDGIRKKRSND
jgi:N utilization substance protein B